MAAPPAPTSSGSSPRSLDHVARAKRYARAAVRDEQGERHGRWFRLAAARFLRDLARVRHGTASFFFDPARANAACEFVECLPHVEGRWATETIKLHEAHAFLLVNLFGFRTEDGGRRFSSALLLIGRKNAKSTLAAAILLYCQCCEDEPGAQLITAATTGSQARVIFNIAKRMVEATPDLRNAFMLEPFANAIACYLQGSSIKPINAKASTQDGLNPSHTALDEIHAHKTHDLLNVLRSAAGARRNPLWLFTTTEGYETPGPWPELRKFAESVLQRAVDAEHFLAAIFAIDDEDEDFDAERWVKANPLMEVNPVLRREVEKEALEARQMPGRLAEFRIKRLNRRSAAAEAWIDLAAWRRGSAPVDLAWLAGQECDGGLDLASTSDLCAFRLFWLIEGRGYTWGIRWVPEAAVAQRTERGSVPYAGWVASGLIRQTPGNVADYAAIERDLEEIRERFPRIRGISFDPWNATDLVNRLIEKGFPMIEFRQGPRSYHPAMQGLERLYRGGRLAHGGDPVLTWCAANLVPRYDANMNMAPDRKRSADKIDDMCALLMAVARPITERKEEGGIEGWLADPV